MGGNLRYLWALLSITFKSVSSQRGAILLRGIFAFMNHLIYFPVWYVMFSFTPSIGGWTLQHAFLGYGISIACWGIVVLTMFGLRTLPQQIDNGELDSYLTLPKPVLLSAALSSSRNSGLGELLVGIGFITHIPIEFIMTHQFKFLAFAMVGTVAYAIFAIAFFYHGLKYYESGNRFGVRG